MWTWGGGKPAHGSLETESGLPIRESAMGRSGRLITDSSQNSVLSGV